MDEWMDGWMDGCFHYGCIVRHVVMCYVAINTGNELSRREDMDALISSSVIDEPRSDSGTGPNVPAPRTYNVPLPTYACTYLFSAS